MLACASVYFVFRGLDYIGHRHLYRFGCATVFGIFIAFNIGSNDVANSFGTSVGAGTLTIRQAHGRRHIRSQRRVLAGGAVTDTILSI